MFISIFFYIYKVFFLRRTSGACKKVWRTLIGFIVFHCSSSKHTYKVLNTLQESLEDPARPAGGLAGRSSSSGLPAVGMADKGKPCGKIEKFYSGVKNNCL
ncbi:MAG: hypothetical protein WBA61_01865 [Aequorivita sp.]